MHNSLDVKVYDTIFDWDHKTFNNITLRANDTYADFVEKHITREEMLKENHRLLYDINKYYRSAFSETCTNRSLTFSNAEAHIRSVYETCIETEAKGSLEKLNVYEKYLGVSDGTDIGKPLYTRQDDQGIMVAGAVKTAVGVAGAYSQRGIKALRNAAPKAVLELTYPVSQSLLQSKHDPDEALQKYSLLLGPVRDLWRGQLLEKTDDGGKIIWNVVRDKEGTPMQATPEEWKNTFMDIYTSKEGLNIPTINEAYVDTVVKKLTTSDGHVQNIEKADKVADYSGVDKPVGSTTLDTLAYGGGFTDLCAAAQRKENLFSGRMVEYFAPYQVWANRREKEQYQTQVERAADPTRETVEPKFTPMVPKSFTQPKRCHGKSTQTGVNRGYQGL